jgi:hypothetical protein
MFGEGGAAHLNFWRFDAVKGRAGNSQMPDKTYWVKFKESDLGPRLVKADSVEIHGEHLVFLRSDGKLAALFLLEIVESWSEFELYDE